MGNKERLDIFLTHKSLVRSRHQAQELIHGGFIKVRGKVITKPSFKIDLETPLDHVLILENSLMQFVSRGGIKLDGALTYINMNIEGFDVLDIGMSTGGFTDCVLQGGAHFVCGIEVGHNQLADLLKHDKRVICFEGTNIKDVTSDFFKKNGVPSLYDLIVIDVSFISLSQVLPCVKKFLKPTGCVLALVKPQFELGARNLNKQGVVKDTNLYVQVEEKIRDICHKSHLSVKSYFQSQIEGTDGNIEFFLQAN